MTRPITGSRTGLITGLPDHPPCARKATPADPRLARREPPGPVPGQLVWGQGQRCRELLMPSPSAGLATLPRAEATAQGLVTLLKPGQVALVLRNPRVVGLSVESFPLPEVASRAISRLAEFSQRGGDSSDRAVCLPVAGLSAPERRELGILASALRLEVHDASQGVVLVETCGDIRTAWPAGVRFEPDQPPPGRGQAPRP